MESEDFEIVKNISLSYPIILIDVHEEFDTNNKSKFEELQKLEEIDESSEDGESDDKSSESDNKNNKSNKSDDKSKEISKNYINKDINKLSNIIKLGKTETYESETPIYECNDKKYKILQKITKIIDTEFLIVELNRCYFPTYATKRLSYAEIIPEETIILGRRLYLKSIVCYFGNIGDREVPINIEDGGHYVTFLRGFDNGKCKWYFYNDISVINGKVEFKEIGDFDNLVKNDIVRKKSVVYIYTTDNGKTNVCPEHIQDIINMGINL